MTLFPKERKENYKAFVRNSGHGAHLMGEDKGKTLDLRACVQYEARRIEEFQPVPGWNRSESSEKYILCPGSSTPNNNRKSDSYISTWVHSNDHNKSSGLSKRGNAGKAFTPQQTAYSLDTKSVSSAEGNQDLSDEFKRDTSKGPVCKSTAMASKYDFKQRCQDVATVSKHEDPQKNNIECYQLDAYSVSLPDTKFQRNTTTAAAETSETTQAENERDLPTELTESPDRICHTRTQEASEDEKDEGFCSVVSWPDMTMKDGGISDFSSNSNVDADKKTTEKLQPNCEGQGASLSHLDSSRGLVVRDGGAKSASQAASPDTDTGSVSGLDGDTWEGNFSANRNPGPMGKRSEGGRGPSWGSPTSLYKTRLQAVKREREELVRVGKVAEDVFVPNTLFPKRCDLHSKPCSLHGPAAPWPHLGRQSIPMAEVRYEVRNVGPRHPCCVQGSPSQLGEEGESEDSSNPMQPHSLPQCPLEDSELSRSQPRPYKHRRDSVCCKCLTSNLDSRFIRCPPRVPTVSPRPSCNVDGPRLMGNCCEDSDPKEIDIREITPPRHDGLTTASRQLFELDALRTLRPVGEVTGDVSGLLQSAIDRLVSSPLDILVHYARLGEFHRQLYQEDKMVDVLIQVGETVYVAHRVVLACYSSYFHQALLSQDCTSLPLEVRLCGVAAPTFEVFLTFAYTGTLTFDPQTLAHAVLASELLQVPELKIWCDDVVKTMTLEQAMLILCCSRDIEGTVVYGEALNMALQYFSQATKLESFLELDVDTVVRLLGSDGACVGSELEVFRAALRWLGHASQQRRDCLEQVLSTVRFALMSPPEIFQCMAAADLAQDRDRVVDLIVRGNWVSTARLLRQPDPLGLPVPEPRLSLRNRLSYRFPDLACTDDVGKTSVPAFDDTETEDHLFKNEALDDASQSSGKAGPRRRRLCQACVCRRPEDVQGNQCQHAVCRGEDRPRRVCSHAPYPSAPASSKGMACDGYHKKVSSQDGQDSRDYDYYVTSLETDPHSHLVTEARSVRIDRDLRVLRHSRESNDCDGHYRKVSKNDACFHSTRDLTDRCYHKQRNEDVRAITTSNRHHPVVKRKNSMSELEEGLEVAQTDPNFDIKYRHSSPSSGSLLPSADRQSAQTSHELFTKRSAKHREIPPLPVSSAERGGLKPDCNLSDRPNHQPCS